MLQSQLNKLPLCGLFLQTKKLGMDCSNGFTIQHNMIVSSVIYNIMMVNPTKSIFLASYLKSTNVSLLLSTDGVAIFNSSKCFYLASVDTDK